MITGHAGTVERLAKPFPVRWLPLTVPLAIGIATGVGALRASALSTSWIVYIFLGTVAFLTLPYWARLAGGLSRLFTILFFFSLQLDLGFNIIYKDVPNQPGYNGIRITLAFSIAAALAALRLFRGGEKWVSHRSLSAGMLSFALACVVSYANTTDRTLVLYGLANLAMIMFIGFVVCDICSRRESIELAERVFVFALLTQTGVLISQHLTGEVIDLAGHTLGVFGNASGSRYPGTLGRAPSVVSQFLVIMLVFAQDQRYAAARSGRSSLIAGLAVGLGLLCLALSLTRSSWVAFAISSTVLAIYWTKRGALKLKTVAGLFALLSLALLIAWPSVSVRLGEDHQAAIEERKLLLYIGLEMVRAHPVIGVGYNCVRDRLYQFLPHWFTGREWVYVPHNEYLIVAAETGLFGLSAFLYLVWAGLRSSMLCARSKDRLISRLGMVLVATFAAMIWGMNGDFYSGTQMNVLLWTFLGFASGLDEFRKRQERSASAPACP